MAQFFLSRKHSILDQVILALFVLGLTECGLWAFAFFVPAALTSSALSKLVEGAE